MTPQLSWHAAFLRGVNVGRGKRLPMSELRATLESLGYADVRTCLNSGNVVFRTALERGGSHALHIQQRIQQALRQRVGLETLVIVKSADSLAQVLRENPLGKSAEAAKNPSRLLVVLTPSAADLNVLRSIERASWRPDVIAVGSVAAYLWCANGISRSELSEAAFKLLDGHGTTRNLNTLLEVQALMVTAPNVRAPNVRAPSVRAPSVRAPSVRASSVRASSVQKSRAQRTRSRGAY
jgi:uncharacterized protein (DUF1697 family)